MLLWKMVKRRVKERKRKKGVERATIIIVRREIKKRNMTKRDNLLKLSNNKFPTMDFNLQKRLNKNLQKRLNCNL